MATSSGPFNLTNTIPVNSSDTVMNNILRTVKNGQIAAQIANGVVNPVAPDVSPGSPFGLMARGLANEVANATSNTQTALNLQMPDTSTGNNLDRWLNIYDIPRRVASSAVGSVIGTTSPQSAVIFVPAGTQLTSNAGLRYQVLTSGNYGNNSAIPVISIDVGADTNQEAGETLQWVTPPAYFASTATVSAINPIEEGVDAETDGIADQRLLAFFANPPSSGNPAQIIEAATNSDSDVQTAFVYPAARLGATVDVAVVGYATTSSSNRQLNNTILTNTISPFVLGQLPTSVDGYVCTVNNYPIDVCIFLSLPLSATANPPGPGGGWLDASPLVTTAANPFIRVVDGYVLSGSNPSVPQNTPNAFWVDVPNYAASAPVNGIQYNFSYLSPTDLTLYQGMTDGNSIKGSTTYSALSGLPTLYYLTLNTPFYDSSVLGTTILPGAVIFPSAANTTTYIEDLLDYLLNLGPGERTASPYLIPRALRQPAEALAYNYKINARAVKPILDAGPEVYDGVLQYVGIYTNNGTTPIPNGELVTPSTYFTVYNTLTGDPAYAVNAPPTAFIGNGNNPLGNSFIFQVHNIGLYPLF